jgi:hypothetical protein
MVPEQQVAELVSDDVILVQRAGPRVVEHIDGTLGDGTCPADRWRLLLRLQNYLAAGATGDLVP